jgi:hypothetical protein
MWWRLGEDRHPSLMFALTLAVVAATRTLRDAERLTARLSVHLRKTTLIKQRISDTKLRDVLSRPAGRSGRITLE